MTMVTVGGTKTSVSKSSPDCLGLRTRTASAASNSVVEQSMKMRKRQPTVNSQ